MSNAQHFSSSHESLRLRRDGSMFTLASTFSPGIDHVFLTTLDLAAPKPWKKLQDVVYQWLCLRPVGR